MPTPTVWVREELPPLQSKAVAISKPHAVKRRHERLHNEEQRIKERIGALLQREQELLEKFTSSRIDTAAANLVIE